ncbi:hypothetical protein F442_23129 [Phytophthora nicotianae P10297]|uniref:Uncharacterized protein n=4 Tax=Phytophthora nicotianae TaxID=4792 RepID=V9EU99_PHYNI|nr:hypothetical protein F443_13133 [Phytophthora nicotianae P1569]ETK94992.1 hypothetical protein L915_02048 [Phytophthora nicotianae]ETM54672.1 hypothetical protein L914_02031 [Phytophthora nicotianae]ETO83900.1 hypothetical protein F444_02151 [Phytophthora nicotianae P1976]ETP27592.1 hypothetical protein F442_23129 [Phytophthora nicotianae P10297]
MQQSSTDPGTVRPRNRRRKQSTRPHSEIPAIQRLASSSTLRAIQLLTVLETC